MNKKLGLSPGKNTNRFCETKDRNLKRQLQTEGTQAFKRRRLELKSANISSNFTHEMREGASYASNIEFEGKYVFILTASLFTF